MNTEPKQNARFYDTPIITEAVIQVFTRKNKRKTRMFAIFVTHYSIVSIFIQIRRRNLMLLPQPRIKKKTSQTHPKMSLNIFIE